MPTRFLYNNLITAVSMLTVSSSKTGLVSAALKEGTGGATINPSGTYTGTSDLEYVVEIDSVAGGAAIGQATFKWSDGGGTWDASGVTTSTVGITLNNGVTVAWTSTGGTDFILADRWYFKAVAPYGAVCMLDWDPDHRYRTSGLGAPDTIIVDFGSPQTVQALAVWQHNMTAAATITLEANTSNAWGGPPFTQSVTWSAINTLQYLSVAQTYRYWRLSVTDGSNPDNYIEIGELFLGSYLQLTRGPHIEYSDGYDLLQTSNETVYGVRKVRYYNKRQSLDTTWDLPPADLTAIETMLGAITDSGAGTMQPVYFNLDSTDTTETILAFPSGFKTRHIIDGWMNMQIAFSEVVASV